MDSPFESLRPKQTIRNFELENVVQSTYGSALELGLRIRTLFRDEQPDRRR